MAWGCERHWRGRAGPEDLHGALHFGGDSAWQVMAGFSFDAYTLIDPAEGARPLRGITNTQKDPVVT